jgi:phage gpG-like protein
MSPEEHIQKLNTAKAEFTVWFNSELPDIVGVEGVNHFKESFQDEGFTDETLEKWPQVKRRSNPKRVDRAAASRQILTGETGDLGRSVEYTAQPGEVKYKSDKDYAAAHNEGTTNAGRGNKTTIPKRQFIGKSKALDKKIHDISEKDGMRILNK